MGRGDKRTRKGKIFRGSFGNSRPSKVAKATVPQPAAAEAKKAKPEKATKAKAKSPAKKAAPKKAAKKKAEE